MDTSLQGHHLYCLCGTLASAESAGLFVLDGYAELACPDGMTHLNGGTLFYGDRLNGRRGADLRAAIALGTTIATLVAYLGLHETIQAAAGAQHVVGTSINAELAGGAMGAQMADRKRTGRCDEFVALRFFLLDDVGKTTVSGFRFYLALCLDNGRSGKKSNAGQGSTAGRTLWRGISRGGGNRPFFCLDRWGKVHRIECTLSETITANHAAGEVYAVCFQVNAGSLAVTFTFATVLALVSIDSHLII